MSQYSVSNRDIRDHRLPYHLILTLLTVFLCSVCVRAEESQVVRVGYYENEVFQEGAHEGAVRTGYAYEYYQKLSEYTGWKYEYVYGSYTELYQKLLDHEVDFLAGLAYKEERKELIAYPDAPMGHESYNLLKHAVNEEITSDPSTLNGKKIVVLDSAMVDVLNRYLDTYHVNAQVIPLPDYEAVFEAFDTNEVDVIAVEGNGTYGRSDAEILCTFGYSDYYLCVNNQKPELLAQLNTAQTLLATDEPNYLTSLETKYYPYTLFSRAFSPTEKEWIEKNHELRVGYLMHYLPYSDTDASGEVTGIVKDVIPRILDLLGVEAVEVHYAGYENYDQMIVGVNDGSLDVVFPVGGGFYYSEENGIYQSNPILSSATELIYAGKYSDETTSLFAVNENNRIQDFYVTANFPEAEVAYYPSIDACLQAVLDGKATCTTLNGLRASDILKNRKYRGLSLLQLSRNDDRCFGVRIGNEGLLKLLNRGIDVIGSEYAQGQVYRYTDKLYDYSLWDFAQDHMGLFGSLILAAALLVILFLVRDSRRARARMVEKENARQTLEEKNKELERSRKALVETDEIVAGAGFGIWHITLENGKAPRMRGNAKMMELLGISGRQMTEEEIYEFWYSRILEEEIPSVQNSVGEMLEGKPSENTYRWEHPQAGVIYVRCGGRGIRYGEKGHLLRGYQSDVTQIVKADAEKREALSNALMAAEHANRAKTTFLNNMSHDIRTPMNAIVGFTALAASHIDNKDLVLDYLGKISVSSQHLLSLINDVLDMSRIESGKVTIEEAEVHLPDVIHDLRTIIQANASSKQQELFVDIQHVVHEDIITDKLRLNQVLLNILSNAIKFTPARGTIHFKVTEKPSEQEGYTNFEFRIKDNGIGMSPEFQKTIFEAFTREKTSTVSGIQGTGLGMAITKNIVDMMGGTIAVSSEEGKGSEFVVEIPCRIVESSAMNRKLPELQGLRALVVDDDMDSCLSVSAMLREIGMDPDWTGYGKEGVIRAREAFEQGNPFQVYIIDWMMPDLNGMETVRRIRKLVGKEVPVIVLTAYDWSDIEEEAMEAGVTSFCSKPVFMTELRNVLAESFCTPPEKEEPQISQPDFAGSRILLAEDNEMNQMIAVAILEGAGFSVEIAGDGIQAVEKMTQAPAGHYDVILMDIQMPNMDGYEAARKIRALEDQKKAQIPIVAVTANAFEEDRKIALEAGMNAHLAKPYDIPKMMETLTELLRKDT